MLQSVQNMLSTNNLASQIAKIKQPYMREANKKVSQFQEKIRQQRARLNQQLEQQRDQESEVYQISERRERLMTGMTGIQTIQSQKKVQRVITEQKVTPRDTQPKLQEWKPDVEYGFNSYEELLKNYDEVFERRQKIKRKKQNQALEDFREDERQMVDEIFQDLKDPQQLTVTFTAIEAFFQKYNLFYYYYNIHPYRLLNLLRESARRYEDRLSRQQFFDFLLIDRPNVTEFKMTTLKQICNNCILSEQVWKKLKDIFSTLDTFGNQKICVRTFFQRIRNNPSSISLLSAEAIEFPEIKRIYTLEKVLFDLENKQKFDVKVQWETIQDQLFYFTHIQEPTLDVIYAKNLQKAKINFQTNYFMLDMKAIALVKQVFNRCPKYCESFIKTSFIVNQMLQTGMLKPYMRMQTRIEGQKKLTFEQVIRGLTHEAPAYIDLDQLLELLSIKGSHNNKKLIQMYDDIDSQSSEETVEKKQERRLRKIKSLENLKKNLKNRIVRKKQNHECTRIQEFHLSKKQKPTIREQKVEMMIKQKQMQDDFQLNKKFKANPIPVTINPERYQKYVKIMQKKKQSIMNRLGLKREQDQNIIQYLKSNTKLFEPKKLKTHCTQQRQQYVYEASPLPVHISEQLLPKIEAQKQERRRKLAQETRKKYEEQYWRNLKQFQVKQVQEESLMEEINMLQQKAQFERIKANQVPNFQQLHRKFEAELQSRKKQFKPTEIKQFKLTSPSSKKKTTQQREGLSYQFKSVSPPRNYPDFEVKSTKKYQDWVAFNQSKDAQKQLKQQQKQRQEEERLLKQKNFAKFMRANLANCTDNTDTLRHKRQQKIRNFKNYVSDLQQQTEEQLAQMYARVLQRPFLFEQASATKKPKSKPRPKRVQSPQRVEELKPNQLFKPNLFQKQGQQFHPMQSENLNLSF